MTLIVPGSWPAAAASPDNSRGAGCGTLRHQRRVPSLKSGREIAPVPVGFPSTFPPSRSTISAHPARQISLPSAALSSCRPRRGRRSGRARPARRRSCRLDPSSTACQLGARRGELHLVVERGMLAAGQRPPVAAGVAPEDGLVAVASAPRVADDQSAARCSASNGNFAIGRGQQGRPSAPSARRPATW